jgi:hypothetical protein
MQTSQHDGIVVVVRTTGDGGADGAVVAVGAFREDEHSRFVGVVQAHLQSQQISK